MILLQERLPMQCSFSEYRQGRAVQTQIPRKHEILLQRPVIQLGRAVMKGDGERARQAPQTSASRDIVFGYSAKQCERAEPIHCPLSNPILGANSQPF
jgi:hypothetical protein